MFTRSHLRKHIFAIFAFARVADDFADEDELEMARQDPRNSSGRSARNRTWWCRHR